MILKFCATDITKLTSPALPFFPAHPYAFRFHELSFCCPFIMKQKQKNNKSTNETKQRVQKVKMYAPVSPGIVWNA